MTPFTAVFQYRRFFGIGGAGGRLYYFCVSDLKIIPRTVACDVLEFDVSDG